jgi:GR25 family glycosyltransferase involved in LPS biosynthesis
MIDLERVFPMRVFLNLAQRQDRRHLAYREFARHDLKVERFAATDRSQVVCPRGFEQAGRYAVSLSKRAVLREACRRNVDAVLIFEDDVVFNPRLRQLLSEMELPEDWGVFFLGSQMWTRPRPAGLGLVRTFSSVDHHAVGIRRMWFPRILESLRPQRCGSDWKAMPASDQIVAGLAKEIPMYAAYPNLAWQRTNHSDILNTNYSNYSPHGVQKWGDDGLLDGLAAEVFGGHRWRTGAFERPASPVNIAFLFLTRNNVRHPEVWEEYLGKSRDRVYCHAKNPDAVTIPWQRAALIDQHVETAWGDISLVRAMLALLRCARSCPRHTHFVFLSESCVPIQPLSALERSLAIDGRSIIDWRTAHITGEKDLHKILRLDAAPRVPRNCWLFHSQWMLLDRQVADCILEDDLTGHFESVHAADESYFGTLLKMKGYPIEQRVAKRSATFVRWAERGHPEEFSEITGTLAGELTRSGNFFARKFAPSADLQKWGLHR